jgi:hypothetical protein
MIDPLLTTSFLTPFFTASFFTTRFLTTPYLPPPFIHRQEWGYTPAPRVINPLGAGVKKLGEGTKGDHPFMGKRGVVYTGGSNGQGIREWQRREEI